MARDQNSGPEMTLGEHLAELRKRLLLAIVGVGVVGCVCFWFGQDIMKVIARPVLDALKSCEFKPQLYATSIMEGFMAWLKVSVIASLFFASPWVFYQLWKFVAAGLYPRERKYIYMLVPFTVGLFVAGVVFSYFILVRYGIRYLVQFTRDMGYEPIFTANDALMFVMMLSLVMGLVFQLPLVMLLLTKIGVIRARTFAKKRKIAVFGAMILAAFITPTQDVFNLALCTVPLILLYEVGIIICKLAERGKAKDAEEEDEELAG